MGSDPLTGTGVGPQDTTLNLYDATTVDVRVVLPDDLVLRGRNMHASFSALGLGDMTSPSERLGFARAAGHRLSWHRKVLRGFSMFGGGDSR